jgi:hypothetical protein
MLCIPTVPLGHPKTEGALVNCQITTKREHAIPFLLCTHPQEQTYLIQGILKTYKKLFYPQGACMQVK